MGADRVGVLAICVASYWTTSMQKDRLKLEARCGAQARKNYPVEGKKRASLLPDAEHSGAGISGTDRPAGLQL